MKRVKITQVRSRIGSNPSQRATLDALGLRRLNRTVEHNLNPQIKGMIKKVKHLVSVEYL